MLASFAPAFSNGFVNWDDDLLLTDNVAYRGLSPAHLRWMLATRLGGHFQPLTWLSYAVDYACFGMDPRGYHATSVLLHAANTVVVWLLLRKLLDLRTIGSELLRLRVAAVGALLFAVHPLRVESVAWATERRDVLSGFFWLLAALAYLRCVSAPEDDRRRRQALVVTALALSLAAKAWGMTFPLVLLILDAYPLGRLAHAPRAVAAEKAPVAIVAGAAALVAFFAQRAVPEMRGLAEHGVIARVAQAAYGLCFYLVKSVAPVGLHPAYLLEPHLDPSAPRYVVAMIAVAAITTLAVLQRRRRPWLPATWFAYVVIVSPVLGFVQTGPQLVADRYTYLACLPWVALATAGLARFAARAETAGAARLLHATTATVVGLLAALTFRQTRVWHDPMTLWDHTLRLDPCNWIALTNRGFSRTDTAAASADYSAAIRCNPDYELPYFNRGNARRDGGDLAGAAADFSRVIALRPDDPSAYNNRGWVRQSSGDLPGAVADYERALALAPQDWAPRAMVSANLAAARARVTAVDR